MDLDEFTDGIRKLGFNIVYTKFNSTSVFIDFKKDDYNIDIGGDICTNNYFIDFYNLDESINVEVKSIKENLSVNHLKKIEEIIKHF